MQKNQVGRDEKYQEAAILDRVVRKGLTTRWRVCKTLKAERDQGSAKVLVCHIMSQEGKAH